MAIPKHAIEELKTIWREDVGEELSDDEARAAGLRLLWLFDRLSRTPEDHAQGSNASPLDDDAVTPENEGPSR